jgi:hypothetical protein
VSPWSRCVLILAVGTAKGLMFPLPAPMSVPKKAPIPWDDASLDNGAAFTEFFGETSYVFDHKGVHFLPAFGVRGDVIPGETTRISFTPDKAGVFEYLCDVFCGEGHEDVTGKLIVTE